MLSYIEETNVDVNQARKKQVVVPQFLEDKSQVEVREFLQLILKKKKKKLKNFNL